MHTERLLSHNWLTKRIVNRFVHNRLHCFSGVVVDLGCGTRPYETDIMQYANQYIGVDWSNTLHGLQADVIADLNLPLPMESAMADHVVCFEVLEHLAEPNLLLSEAARLLRQNGQLTLSVPFQWGIHEAPWDYYRYTRYGLAYMLGKAGFVDIVIAPTMGFWSMWLLKLNYQLARLVRGPRHVRNVIRALLLPIWWTNQQLGPLVDRFWKEERETGGYFVTARKP